MKRSTNDHSDKALLAMCTRRAPMPAAGPKRRLRQKTAAPGPRPKAQSCPQQPARKPKAQRSRARASGGSNPGRRGPESQEALCALHDGARTASQGSFSRSISAGDEATGARVEVTACLQSPEVQRHELPGRGKAACCLRALQGHVPAADKLLIWCNTKIAIQA